MALTQKPLKALESWSFASDSVLIRQLQGIGMKAKEETTPSLEMQRIAARRGSSIFFCSCRHIHVGSPRYAGSEQTPQSRTGHEVKSEIAKDKPKRASANKTQAQLDEEMRQAMENLAGDGGESGVELEDGKPVSMKRSVKENMFRYI